MGDSLDLGDLIPLLFGAGFLSFLGVLLSGRTGRQRDYDSRVDDRNKMLEQENRELDAEVDRLRDRVHDLSEEIMRLRILLRRKGIDPDLVERKP